MSEETIYESVRARNRKAIASYLRRMADAFDGDAPIPVDESVTVDPPADSELEVELEREDDELSLEFEVEWTEDDESGVEVNVDGDVDSDAVAGSDATFELYRDRADEWRWRLRHANGNVVADSGEGYTTRANAVKGIESVKTNAAGAIVEEQD